MITSKLNTKELKKVISFIESNIGRLDELISESKIREGNSSDYFGNSKERHAVIIIEITKFKEGCQILKSRLENVKAMLDQLRNQYFESNAVVKIYLNPAPPPQPETATEDSPSQESSSSGISASSIVSSISGSSGPPSNSSLSLEKSLYTFDTLCEPFKKIVEAFRKLYTFNPRAVFYEISELVIFLKDQESIKFFEDAKKKITEVFTIYLKTRETAYRSKQTKKEQLTKNKNAEISTIQKNYDDNYAEEDAKVKKIEQSLEQAQKLVHSTRTDRFNARVAFEKLVKDKGLTNVSQEYKTAKLPLDNATKDAVAAELTLKNAKDDLEPARRSRHKLNDDYRASIRAIQEQEKADTRLEDELYEKEITKASKVAKEDISLQKSIINNIYGTTNRIDYYYFRSMGITPAIGPEDVKFDKNNAKFIENYLPLIDSYPGFDGELKKIVSSIHVIKNKADVLNGEIGFTHDYRIDSHSATKISGYIDELLPLIEKFSKLIQEFNDILFKYKNAFVTLSFQIATTLFGYGISILQIFMQNFPEQLSFFTEKEQPQLPPPKLPKLPTEDYGLTQLNDLKNPIKPFVTAKYIENQEIQLDQYVYEPKPTNFNLLLPTDPQTYPSNVPLFKLGNVAKMLSINIPVIPVIPHLAIGGKKQRRLLPPPSRPLQSNKRHKKRKTIKNRSSAPNTTHKTTKKNKRYTNNNKTTKNKQVKNILTKANQKRNKKHKRSIRKV